jgi:hypothetical protein
VVAQIQTKPSQSLSRKSFRIDAGRIVNDGFRPFRPKGRSKAAAETSRKQGRNKAETTARNKPDTTAKQTPNNKGGNGK